MDFARLRVEDVDELGLTSDFRDITLNIANNITPEKVLGTIGSKFINFGNFEASLEATALFTSPDVIQKILANETLSMDFIVENGDGVMSIDIPSLTLGGGAREFPENESLFRVSLAPNAFQDDRLNTSIGISLIPVPLPRVE